MSNPKTIEQDGKVYEQVLYRAGETIREGATILCNGRISSSAEIGNPCDSSIVELYYHEVKPAGDRCTCACSEHLRRCDRALDRFLNPHKGDCACELCPTDKPEPAPEMVSISFSVTEEDAELALAGTINQGAFDAFKCGCKNALDARKTELEKWRDSISISREMLHNKMSWAPNPAKLMAAAPEMAEALLSACKILGDDGREDGRRSLAAYIEVKAAIKAAFPPEVAAEILGEPK